MNILSNLFQKKGKIKFTSNFINAEKTTLKNDITEPLPVGIKKDASVQFRLIDFIISILPKKNREIEQIKKILLVKPDHLGDVFLVTALLPLIKRKYPEIIIDMVIGKWCKQLLLRNPFINKFYLISDPHNNRMEISVIKKIFAFAIDLIQVLPVLKRNKYDICFFLQYSHYNLIPYLILGGLNCYSIGHATTSFRRLLTRSVEWMPNKHEVEHLLEPFAPFDIKGCLSEFRYHFYPDENAVVKANALIEHEFGNIEGKRVAILHPGAGDKRKSLSHDALLRIYEILEEFGFYILLTGNEREKHEHKLLFPNKHGIVGGQTDIETLALLFKKSHCIITVDSFASHLAGWSQTPTFLFYCGINDANQWRPLGDNLTIYQQACVSSPCKLGCESVDCMNICASKLESHFKPWLHRLYTQRHI